MTNGAAQPLDLQLQAVYRLAVHVAALSDSTRSRYSASVTVTVSMPSGA